MVFESGKSAFGFTRRPLAGVDILQKKPQNAQGGINSAQAKFPKFARLSVFTP